MRELRIGTTADVITVVHLSDIHASPCMTGPDLADMVERTNALSPDLVVMTGDFVMPFSEAHHSYLIEALAKLSAPAARPAGARSSRTCARRRRPCRE